MKKTFGILAHVDAGKTTFSEQVLYRAHALRKLGRVDHQDAFLDLHPMERQRGITIFSDQARFELDGDEWYWVDTPGHTDFAGEMERAIQVMDYAVLVVSCVEGVQSHTETVWRLLERYRVPVFVFLNKLDRVGADPDGVLRKLRERLSPDFFDLRGGFERDGTLTDEKLIEQAAEHDEALMNRLFDCGYDKQTWLNGMRRLIAARELFPVMAGAALSGEGVDEFLAAAGLLTCTQYDEKKPFSARVYKVRRDTQGTRLTFLKVLSGTLSVKNEIHTDFAEGKISAMFQVQGGKYLPVSSAQAGQLVAVAGLSGTKSGDLLGEHPQRSRFVTEPMLVAEASCEAGTTANRLLECFRILADEEPALGVEWNERARTVELRVMGRIQLDVLKQTMQERFGVKVEFGKCRVRYMETISAPAVGIGHYEPLRHYAEVHLKLSPAERGSGITFESKCHVDTLALNWQRLIETHVFETAHIGLQIGAPLTDVKVTLLIGRAHLKHTEGGDFREAVYRAIKNALMFAPGMILEPWCTFRLRAPRESLGRLMTDLNAMGARTETPEYGTDEIELSGEAPFGPISDYQVDFLAATRGRGAMSYEADHYEPVRNAQEIIDASGFDRSREETGSVFCSHGAGFEVPWDQVRSYAHCETPEEEA